VQRRGERSRVARTTPALNVERDVGRRVLPPSVRVFWNDAVTVGSEQIAASVTVTFAIC
jgi:hypothetical protein